MIMFRIFRHYTKHPTILLFCILLILSCRKGLRIEEELKDNAHANWTLFGGQSERGNSMYSGLTPPLETAWVYKATSAIGPTLLAVDGLVYFVTLDGRLDAVDIATGERVNRLKLSAQTEGTCAYFDGDLYVAYRYGEKTLGRIDLAKGKYLWNIDAGDIASEPLVTDDGVFVSALYKHIDKYDLTTGDKKWRFETEDQHRSSPALSDGILVVGCDNGTIYALNADSGKLVWKVQSGASVFATPAIVDQSVFVGSADSVFYALNLKTGEELWRSKVEAPIIQSAAGNGEKVVFGSTDGDITCLSAATGETLWRFSAKSVVSTAPLVASKVVYFGSLDNNYYALDLENGEELWRFTTRGRVRTSPVIWGDYLLGASEDKFLFAFSASGERASKE